VPELADLTDLGPAGTEATAVVTDSGLDIHPVDEGCARRPAQLDEGRPGLASRGGGHDLDYPGWSLRDCKGLPLGFGLADDHNVVRFERRTRRVEGHVQLHVSSPPGPAPHRSPVS